MRTEVLAEGHRWFRIADPRWSDPLDPTFAQHVGQRWNPPRSFPVLYLNEDLVTARLNLRRFVADWPYEPEDLREASAPALVVATLPRAQRVVDAHSPAGIAALGLPPGYPFDGDGALVPHEPCQQVGVAAHERGLRGVRCRSAQTPLGAGRELAWFPATRRSRALEVERHAFADWYWS